MFDKNNIPELYKKMYDLGYLSWHGSDHSKYLSMDDMEWMEHEEVMNYRYEEGEMDIFLPFAFTGGGDKWVFVDNGSEEPFIALCYHDTGDGEYYAKNFEDAILRNMIEYAANGDMVEESDLNFSSYEKMLRTKFREYCTALEKLLRKEYLDIIVRLSELPLRRPENEQDTYAFLSYDEANAIINQHLNFELLHQEFVWWREDE